MLHEHMDGEWVSLFHSSSNIDWFKIRKKKMLTLSFYEIDQTLYN